MKLSCSAAWLSSVTAAAELTRAGERETPKKLQHSLLAHLSESDRLPAVAHFLHKSISGLDIRTQLEQLWIHTQYWFPKWDKICKKLILKKYIYSKYYINFVFITICCKMSFQLNIWSIWKLWHQFEVMTFHTLQLLSLSLLLLSLPVNYAGVCNLNLCTSSTDHFVGLFEAGSWIVHIRLRKCGGASWQLVGSKTIYYVYSYIS